tara:strand:- start:1022 stop:1150 length:129 start_codon:yes stop_codon:yes gene_type:complete
VDSGNGFGSVGRCGGQSSGVHGWGGDARATGAAAAAGVAKLL